jgi:hypothetical protein
MNKNKNEIINELKDIAPKLADLQQHITVSPLDDTQIEKLISNTNSVKSNSFASRNRQVVRVIGIAASMILLTGIVSLFNAPRGIDQVNHSYVETYVDENLDEFGDYIIDDLSDEDLAEESTISDELIMIYFEESLDELDITFFYE